MEDIKGLGNRLKVCPYYLSRMLLAEANVVVCTYPYLLDIKTSEFMYKEVPDNCIVVFDEAHNIDNIAIDHYSAKINKGMLEKAN
jgi:DNA excision repair protein ERCC-2